MEPVNPIYQILKGNIFHSTSLTNLSSIIASGQIEGGHSENPAGFCQCSKFTSKLGLAVSLSDLSLASEATLLSHGTNWANQIYRPYGGSQQDDGSYIYTTIILQRSRLAEDACFSWQRIKEECPSLIRECDGIPLPINGRLIIESEVCYTRPIPLSAFSEILAVAKHGNMHRLFKWSNDSPKKTLSELDHYSLSCGRSCP